MRTFKDILSVPQLFIFKLNHKYNLCLHLIIYNNDSVDVFPITSRCFSVLKVRQIVVAYSQIAKWCKTIDYKCCI